MKKLPTGCAWRGIEKLCIIPALRSVFGHFILIIITIIIIFIIIIVIITTIIIIILCLFCHIVFAPAWLGYSELP